MIDLNIIKLFAINDSFILEKDTIICDGNFVVHIILDDFDEVMPLNSFLNFYEINKKYKNLKIDENYYIFSNEKSEFKLTKGNEAIIKNNTYPVEIFNRIKSGKLLATFTLNKSHISDLLDANKYDNMLDTIEISKELKLISNDGFTNNKFKINDINPNCDEDVYIALNYIKRLNLNKVNNDLNFKIFKSIKNNINVVYLNTNVEKYDIEVIIPTLNN